MLDRLRLGLLGVALLGLAGCGGGGGGGIGRFGGFGAQCDPGNAVQLASPAANQTASPTIGQVIIVANGNNGSLYYNTGQWYLTLISNYGDNPGGFALNLVADPNGPHPYPSDFYYAANIPTLPMGRTWSVYLNETNAGCSPMPLQSFST